MRAWETLSRKPAFRWGDVEEWVRTLSGPKIEELRTHCIGLIAFVEFARSNPDSIWRFEGTPDLSDDALSIGEFTKFKRRLKIVYVESDREYVLNFAFDPDLEPPKPRRRPRARKGQSGSGAAAQPAAMRRPRRRRALYERILCISYKTIRIMGSLRSKLRRRIERLKIKGGVTLRHLRRTIATIVRRAPRIGLGAARIRKLFIGLSQPLAVVSEAGARLAPKAIFIGAGLTLLLHSFERQGARAPWEPALFGELPRESERMLA